MDIQVKQLKFNQSGMTSIFFFNASGIFASLSLIVILNYIVKKTVGYIYTKINPIYIVKHDKVIKLLKFFQGYLFDSEK